MDPINRSMGPYDWAKFQRVEERDTRDVGDGEMNIRGNGLMEFEATEKGKTCADLGKTPIYDQEICKYAAKQLGKKYHGVYDGPCPKGCCYASNFAWLSISESESIVDWAGQLCSVSD